uniref:Serine hydrolase n=1 Tax=Kangiella spongicola TaxID=796379 RepID=A0A318CZ44_9GAMM
MHSFRLTCAAAAVAVVLTAPAFSHTEGTYEIPAGAHFNPDKLARISEFFKNEVATGKIPGAVVLIQQHGKPVYHEAFGVQDVVSKVPITDQTIFRLASMSKSITAVVSMQLLEEGKYKLDDPVSKYIPSFANVKVGVEKKAEDGTKTLELVPPRRPITILDLMTHTSGITYGFYGDSLVRKAYKEANIYGGDFDLAEFAERIAKLPLHNQPGALWQYGHSTDILARVMEVATGEKLSTIEQERLLGPLGMKDTGFFVTDPEKQKLMAEPMPNDSDFRVGRINDPTTVKKWESASGGMVSTMADYSRFAQMLLNGGSLDGTRIIGRKTLEFMASDHLGAGVKIQGTLVSPGHSFGLGFAVRMQQGIAPFSGSVGQYFWSGMAGTFFWIDPKEELFCVFMAQAPGQRDYLRTLVRDVVYAAVE